MRRSDLLFTSAGRPTEAFAAFLKDVQVPGNDLPSIDDSLQIRFFQKKDDGKPKERWELAKIVISCSEDRIRQHLAACGFMNKTEPSRRRYKRAAWPGALVVRAAARLSDLVNAWNSGVRWNETVVFAGKRPLQQAKENSVECCKALGIDVDEETEAKDYVRLWDSIRPETELEMMRFLLEAASLENSEPGALVLPLELLELPVTFVDAPMKPPLQPDGEPVRPTTEDTILAWLEDEPEPGSMFVSSGAPYGMAQDEAFWMLLEPHGHTVETFGHAAPDLPIENFMREVAGTVNRIRRARGL